MYKLANNTIYGNEKTLFISNGDHNLIEIAGDSVLQVEQVIKGFSNQTSPDVLFNEIKDTFNNDREYFDEIFQWLISNRILEEVDDQTKDSIQIATYLLNNTSLDSDSIFNLLSETVASYKCVFKREENYMNAELILIFAPLFENLSEVLKINQFSYSNKIPVCYVGLDSSRVFTVGPLVYSELRTPCLNCYIKRKLVNLKMPQKTISFIKHPNKQLISKSSYSSIVFSKIATYHLKIELEKFYRSNKKISTLLGNSLIFDNETYNITKAKILKTSGCDICNQTQNTSPFNT